MSDDDYDEVEAVVRIPKGGRLASSRKTEGLYRGFTAKSSDKGPEHVEIRLTGRESTSKIEPDEPEVVYAYEPVARREKTPEERQADLEEIALAIATVINWAQRAEPHVRRLVDERLAPSLKAQLERWRGRRLRRDAAKESGAPAATTETEILAAEESNAVGDMQDPDRPRMTSDEARRHLLTLLLAEQVADEMRQLLANVLISDDVPPGITSAVRALTPEQTAKMIESTLARQPDLLGDIMGNFNLGDVRGQFESDSGGEPLRIEERDI